MPTGLSSDRPTFVLATEASGAISSPATVRGDPGTSPPRYELFHAAASICSQKVRAVLAHHRLPYIDHSLNLFLGQTYAPEYVRLRMAGCIAYGGELVATHNGSTSTAVGGCDGVVVPTLFDRQNEAIVVDSKRICLMLDDRQGEAQRLRPAALAVAIDADLDVIDHLPNYQMLMGRVVSATASPQARTNTAAAFSEQKVAWCDHYLSEHADDRVLVAAYTAKRAKEASAAAALFTPDAMQAAYDHAETAVADLDRRLERRSGAWLHGDRMTMADLFWGIELLRMQQTGNGRFWQEGRRPNVAAFAAATAEIPAIREAVVEWPGAF